MSAQSLLDIVQDILAEMDADSVNSISDTIESQSVASIVRQCFYDLVDEQELAHHKDLISLEGLADTNKPTHMRIPENVSKILWIKYDRRVELAANAVYTDIRYKEPLDFITYTNARGSTDTTNYQVVMHSATTPIIVGRLAGPLYWTSFDDEHIVFDSFNSNVEATLHASKCLSEGYIRPTLSLVDTAVPDLPESLQRLLYHTSLARCFADLKTQINPKAERNENRFRVRTMRSKWREGRMLKTGPDYGRKC
jgi:hypothetical protein